MTARWCGTAGSPLYEGLLKRAAADVEAGGPCWAVLEGQENAALGSAMPLRFMGAVHRLVLEGRAPVLGQHYPSVGGKPEEEGAWWAFRETVAQQLGALRELAMRPVQTNEVGRCAALLGGFLLVARETGLPLRVLELGASAGLNLRWDHYRYETGNAVWGDPASAVRLVDCTIEGRPPFEVATTVVERRGCDRNPLDPGSAEGRLTLSSFVFADQVQRFARLRAALDLSRRVPATVEQADAPVWLAAQLEIERPGKATVVYHSLVMQYLSQADQERVQRTLAETGAKATSSAPLAWLRLEHGSGDVDVRLTIWPGGQERLLATATNHGQRVNWLLN
jgi:hypothetical protein